MAKEGVIRRFRKCQKNDNNEWDQYKEVVRTFNMELITKLALLEKETRHCEELEKAKTNLKTKLAALREEMKKAKADTVVGFRTS